MRPEGEGALETGHACLVASAARPMCEAGLSRVSRVHHAEERTEQIVIVEEGDALVRPSTVRGRTPAGLTEARLRCSNGHSIAAALPAWLRERFSGYPVYAKKT